MPGSSAGRKFDVVTMRPSTRYDWASQRWARSASRLRRWSSSLKLACFRARYSAVPNASTDTASATVYHKVSRRRMVAMSGLHDVPDATHRMHQFLGVAGVDFLAQPVDDHVHDVGSRIEVIVPGILGDERAGHDPARMPHQILEDGVFLGRELDPLAGTADLARFPIQLEITHPEHR